MTAAPRSASRPTTMTWTPSRARRRAISLPSPEVAPVTSAVSGCWLSVDIVWSERRDIDESRNLRVIAGFGDNCSAVGVAHQDDWAVLRVNDAPGGDDVIGQRQRQATWSVLT